jgi:hypothetical protein
MCDCALQGFHAYPDLDTKHASLNINYASDIHELMAAPMLEYHDKLRYSLATHVVRLDTGFKVVSGGLTSLMSGEGMVMASWGGTASLWSLSKPLAAVASRSSYFGKVSKALLTGTAYWPLFPVCFLSYVLVPAPPTGHPGCVRGQPVAHWHSVAHVLPHAGQGPVWGRRWSEVGCVPHGGEREGDDEEQPPRHQGMYAREVAGCMHVCILPANLAANQPQPQPQPPNPNTNFAACTLLQMAIDGLMDTFFVVHPEDRLAGLTSPRRLIPPPAQLLERVKAWARHWMRAGFDELTGQHIFTLDTYRVIKVIMRGIIEWRLSGRCGRVSSRAACCELEQPTPAKRSHVATS